MAGPDILRVNAVSVELVGPEYVVTVGASNAKTTKWALTRLHALMLILNIAESEGLEIPPHLLEGLPGVIEAGPWTPKVVPKDG